MFVIYENPEFYYPEYKQKNYKNGQHELDFRIYDSDAGGVPIGEILDVLVTLDSGVASTQIGPLDPTWFDGTARWLGVTVDNGDELEPRLGLGSVPYAFRVDRVASAELDDDIDLGDESSIRTLSLNRAKAVKDYLVQMKSIPGHKISTKGFGDKKPIAPNTSEANRNKNRRVRIQLIKSGD